MLRWALADNFWHTNILSMPKFREKFDQLRLASQRHLRSADSLNGSGVSYDAPPVRYV